MTDVRNRALDQASRIVRLAQDYRQAGMDDEVAYTYACHVVDIIDQLLSQQPDISEDDARTVAEHALDQREQPSIIAVPLGNGIALIVNGVVYDVSCHQVEQLIDVAKRAKCRQRSMRKVAAFKLNDRRGV